MPKKSNRQTKYKKQKFSYDQYWYILYTEISSDKTELDFKTIIKARSASSAKAILNKKVKEDDESAKVKSFQIFMLCSKCRVDGLRLNIEDWSHIHKAAFPNAANHLFKYIIPRPKHFNSRYGFTRQPTNAKKYTKGHKLNSTVPDSQKPYMQCRFGKWVPWPKEEREAFKEKIKLHLSLNDNNRTRAAKSLGVYPRTLNRWMTEKFVDVDWRKEFPPPKSEFNLSNVDNIKREEKIRETKKRKSKIFIATLAPKVLALKAQGFSKNKIHTTLGCSYESVSKCIKLYG